MSEYPPGRKNPGRVASLAPKASPRQPGLRKVKKKIGNNEVDLYVNFYKDGKKMKSEVVGSTSKKSPKRGVPVDLIPGEKYGRVQGPRRQSVASSDYTSGFNTTRGRSIVREALRAYGFYSATPQVIQALASYTKTMLMHIISFMRQFAGDASRATMTHFKQALATAGQGFPGMDMSGFDRLAEAEETARARSMDALARGRETRKRRAEERRKAKAAQEPNRFGPPVQSPNLFVPVAQEVPDIFRNVAATATPSRPLARGMYSP